MDNLRCSTLPGFQSSVLNCPFMLDNMSRSPKLIRTLGHGLNMSILTSYHIISYHIKKQDVWSPIGGLKEVKLPTTNASDGGCWLLNTLRQTNIALENQPFLFYLPAKIVFIHVYVSLSQATYGRPVGFFFNCHLVWGDFSQGWESPMNTFPATNGLQLGPQKENPNQHFFRDYFGLRELTVAFRGVNLLTILGEWKYFNKAGIDWKSNPQHW